MSEQISQRRLNRTLLSRQRLDIGSNESAIDLVKALCGLQAQDAQSPYFAIHARRERFKPDELESELRSKRIVRATLFRSTLHLITAEDYLAFWPLVKSGIERTYRAYYPLEAKSLDRSALTTSVEKILDAGPTSLATIRDRLAPEFPDAAPGALSWAARAYLPLIQDPESTLWNNRSRPKYVLATSVLPGALGGPAEEDVRLVERYLRAYGPATVSDLTAWAGVSISPAFKKLGDRLVKYRGPDGKQLLDLSELSLCSEDREVPVRLMPQWDDLVLGHRNRSRVISDAARKKVIITVGRVLPFVLVDGFVGGTWMLEESGDQIRVDIELFSKHSDHVYSDLKTEATRLVEFSRGSDAPLQINIKQARS